MIYHELNLLLQIPTYKLTSTLYTHACTQVAHATSVLAYRYIYILCNITLVIIPSVQVIVSQLSPSNFMSLPIHKFVLQATKSWTKACE